LGQRMPELPREHRNLSAMMSVPRRFRNTEGHGFSG